MSEDFTGFVLAAIALAGSPGPANMALAASGAAFGLKRSLALSSGIILGVLTVLAVTASGLTGLVLAHPAIGPAVKILAVLYMAYLAWAIATAPPLSEIAPGTKGPSFGAGLFLGAGNPKSYAATAALCSGFGLTIDRLGIDVAMKVAALLVVLIAVNLAWLLLGTALTRFFRDPRANRAINIAFAVLLLASVGFALWQ